MSREIVEQVKADLEKRGVDLEGPCGAFEITKRVAWQLRYKGAGLLSKESGNNCNGYATDIICYPDGNIFDILGDSGGFNNPMYNDAGVIDSLRYRPAIDPGDSPVVIPDSPSNDNDINILVMVLKEHDRNMNARFDHLEEMLKSAGHQIDIGMHQLFDAVTKK